MTVGGKDGSGEDSLSLALERLGDADFHLQNHDDEAVKDLLLEVQDVADRLQLLIRAKKSETRAKTSAGGSG